MTVNGKKQFVCEISLCLKDMHSIELIKLKAFFCIIIFTLHVTMKQLIKVTTWQGAFIKDIRYDFVPTTQIQQS